MSSTVGKTLTIRIRGSVYLIPQKDIVYLENELRKIHLYEAEEEYVFYGTFREVLEELDDSFMRCSRSFIISKNHIRAVCHNGHYEIILDNGKRIPLSKKKYNFAKQELERYLQEKPRKKSREKR